MAILLGAFVLWRRKGTALHKSLGRIWVVLMLVTATSAIFIHETRLIGPFSPIHLFTLFTYFAVWQALYAIIVKRDVAAHRGWMQGMYVGALMLAGAFTLMPGRIMHRTLFGQNGGWLPALVSIGAILVLAAFLWLWWRRKDRRFTQPARS